MSDPTSGLWAGLSATGEKVTLQWTELKYGVLVLGSGASSFASLMAISLHQAGRKPLVIDLSGDPTKELSGYLPTFDVGYLLKDSFELDAAEPDYHAQLISSALSMFFCLSSSQEACLNAVMSKVAAEEGFASPSGAFDKVGLVSGYKATDKQEVQGRLANLYLLDATGELGSLNEVTTRGSVVSCANYRRPELGGAAAVYVLAKLLLSVRAHEEAQCVLIVAGAERIFRPQRHSNNSGWFLNSLLLNDLGKVFATGLTHELDERLLHGCALRIFSTSLWNSNEREERRLLPGMVMLRNTITDKTVAFFPRRFEPLGGQVRLGPPPLQAPLQVTLRILETISSSAMATKTSLAAWLSAEHDSELVRTEIERLVKEQFVTSAGPTELSSNAAIGLKLTGWGEQELKRLKEVGDTSNAL
jgi:hypothetical protein